mgnify:FL=1
MACFQSTSLSLHYTTGGRKSGVLLHEIPYNGSKCLLPGGIAAQNASQRKKGLLHNAVQQSLRGYKGLRVSGLSRAADRSSKCG